MPPSTRAKVKAAKSHAKKGKTTTKSFVKKAKAAKPHAKKGKSASVLGSALAGVFGPLLAQVQTSKGERTTFAVEFPGQRGLICVARKACVITELPPFVTELHRFSDEKLLYAGLCSPEW